MGKFNLEELGKTWCLRDLVEYVRDLVEYIEGYTLILMQASNRTVREFINDDKDAIGLDDLMEIYSKAKMLLNSVLDLKKELDEIL